MWPQSRLCAIYIDDEGKIIMQVYNVLATKSPELITCQPDQLVREAVALLAQHDIGAVLVVDGDGLLVGVLSERDILRRAAVDEGFQALAVDQVMKRDVLTGRPEQDLKPVARTMMEQGIRYLPILEDGRPTGIISLSDILQSQRDQHLGEVETLTDRLLAEQADRT
jgi:CBS domain-containing protein